MNRGVEAMTEAPMTRDLQKCGGRGKDDHQGHSRRGQGPGIDNEQRHRRRRLGDHQRRDDDRCAPRVRSFVGGEAVTDEREQRVVDQLDEPGDRRHRDGRGYVGYQERVHPNGLASAVALRGVNPP